MGVPEHPRQISKNQIAELIGDVERPVILEVGCADGEDTAEFLARFPAAKVYCFDCEPRAIKVWKERITDPRAQLFETAVGAIDGYADFHQSGGTTKGAHLQDWYLSGSIHQPTGHLKMSPWCTFKNTIRVPLLRLDSWLHGQPITQIDFLWADAQGAEHDLIEGGRATLRSTRYLYSEYYARPQYDGQHNLGQLIHLLGDDWELLGTYDGCNFLARNKNPKIRQLRG